MKKIILGVFTILVLIVGIYFFINRDNSIDTASANPDYICTKLVSGSPCLVDVNNCSPWDNTTHTRTCSGTKTTQVSYHHRRTTCEAGYSQANSGNSGGASGRFSADYVSGSETCTITEYDTVAPSGKID